MMVWKMKCEAWYLNINFLDGHASPTGYLSPVLFFRGLIYSGYILIMGLLFVEFEFWISLWVIFRVASPCLNKHCSSWTISWFLYSYTCCLIYLLSTHFSIRECHCQQDFSYSSLIPSSQVRCSVKRLLPMHGIKCTHSLLSLLDWSLNTLYHSWAPLELCYVIWYIP